MIIVGFKNNNNLSFQFDKDLFQWKYMSIYPQHEFNNFELIRL